MPPLLEPVRQCAHQQRRAEVVRPHDAFGGSPVCLRIGLIAQRSDGAHGDIWHGWQRIDQRDAPVLEHVALVG